MTTVDLLLDYPATSVPTLDDFTRWADLALRDETPNAIVCIKLITSDESAALNQQYRHKTGPTNILSFPYEGPIIPDFNFLGDLLICVPVVEHEAITEKKPLLAHWAHIVIHGCLHLLGYDHIVDAEAVIMETKETKLLATLGFADPYYYDEESN